MESSAHIRTERWIALQMSALSPLTVLATGELTALASMTALTTRTGGAGPTPSALTLLTTVTAVHTPMLTSSAPQEVASSQWIARASGRTMVLALTMILITRTRDAEPML